MTEKQLHKAVAAYIKAQYPKAFFRTDMSGVYLSGKWSLINDMKALNSSAGFPDLTIYEKRGVWCGLALELKVTTPFTKHGELKADEHLHRQNEWHKVLRTCGFQAGFVVGFEEAKSTIDNYMQIKE